MTQTAKIEDSQIKHKSSDSTVLINNEMSRFEEAEDLSQVSKGKSTSNYTDYS